MEIVLSFQEHTLLRRQRLTSLWYPDEAVFGAIGPKLTRKFGPTTKHDYSDHFLQSMSKYSDAFKAAVGIIEREFPSLNNSCDFEKLYDWVCSKLKNKKNPQFNLKGIGLTALYDISLAIGCNLYPRILPREYVYLHKNKNLVKASKVLIGNLPDTNKVDVKRFSKCLPHFSAMEIEDLLCIYGREIISEKCFYKDWLNEAIRLKVSPDLT